MIYTVTFNPSIDYIVSVDDLKLGLVNRTSEELMFPGGKGINVSMVLSNLGFENTALGFLAGFTGEAIESMLKSNGVNADFIQVAEGITRINVKIRAQQESEINGMGPAIKKENIDELYKKLDQLQDGDILVLAGSIPSVMPETMYSNIMEIKFPNKSDNERFARSVAAAFVLELDPTVDQISEIKTAVSEAVTNAIIHGYDEKDGIVTMSGSIEDDTVTFSVSDDGVGIPDISRAREPLFTGKPEMERSGMGFTIMETFMDSIEVQSEVGKGTRITMTKKLK